MNTTTKATLAELLKEQYNRKMQDGDKRRRLDGRLEKATYEMLFDAMPNVCDYQITHNGNIRSDWFGLNTNFRNVHILGNNTPYIQTYDDVFPYTTVVIIKATFTGCLRMKTAEITGKRLTLETILDLLEHGKAKQYNKLVEAL